MRSQVLLVLEDILKSSKIWKELIMVNDTILLNPIRPRGAQCQQSNLRWTKVKQAQASYETINPWFFRQFYHRFHRLEVTKPDDSPYIRKNLSLLADSIKKFSIFKPKINNFRLKILKLSIIFSGIWLS